MPENYTSQALATRKRLVMSFICADESQVSLSLDDPKSDVTEAEIKTFMDLVVTNNIFQKGGIDLVGKVDAKIVVTDTTEFDLA